MKPHRFALSIAAVAFLGLAVSANAQTSQGQTPPGTETGPQRPDPSAIPEKIAPPLERSAPSTRDEKGIPDTADRTRPAQQGLELRDPVPNTGGTAPAPAPKP